jgi:hypothetical protein
MEDFLLVDLEYSKKEKPLENYVAMRMQSFHGFMLYDTSASVISSCNWVMDLYGVFGLPVRFVTPIEG